jgi:hypothetical protein
MAEPVRRPLSRAGIAISLILTGCGSLLSGQPPSDFRFVRGEFELMSADEIAWAEERLREIAARSGVYGVVLVDAEFPDPPAVVSPVVEEVGRLGGETLIALCKPDSCDLSRASAVSEGLRDAADLVAPAPEPAGLGQDPPPGERNLTSWVEFVGAVATIDD